MRAAADRDPIGVAGDDAHGFDRHAKPFGDELGKTRLVPLALRGVQYRPMGASALLRWNLLVYGVGGIIAPFIGIKLIDLVITTLRWA